MTMKYYVSVILTILTLSIGSSVMAAPTLSTKIHNQYSSLRAMGMGNAFTALANDHSLIFYNPAGFAFHERSEVQVNVGSLASAPKTSDFIKEISDAEKSADNDMDKADAISAVLEKYYGDTMGGRTQLLEVFWLRKNWGLSLIPVDLSVDMTVDKQVGPSVDLYLIKDTTMAFGYGSKITDELSWGITGKFIHRLEVDERLVAIDLATNSDIISEERAKEGTTVDFDLGFIYNVPWLEKQQAQSQDPLSPESLTTPTHKGRYPLSLSVVLRNFLGNDFSKQKWANKDAIEAPKKLNTLIDVGTAFDFYSNDNSTLRSLVDIKNLNHPEISFKKSFHVGIEYDYSPQSWFKSQLRAGFNQSYWSAGFSIYLKNFQLEAASYGEEVGTEEYKTENRIYAAKLAMNF